MPWYRTGTVSVVNGSDTITGNGTNFADYVLDGEGILLPDGRMYEVTLVVSATVLKIRAPGYLGTTANNVQFEIVPVQGYNRELARSAAALIDQHSIISETAIQGAADAQSAAVLAQSALTNIQTYESGADASRIAAEAAAATATSAATAAASASTSASTSASQANTSRNEAQTAATTASTAATTATTKAAEASISATNAASSASAASTSASQASTSATNAASSATTASTAATTASNAATTATNASNSASTSASTASTAADTATSAATTATNAASSATASATAANLAKSDSEAAAAVSIAKAGEAEYWAQEAATVVSAGILDDAVTSAVKTWSSTKIASEIASATPTLGDIGLDNVTNDAQLKIASNLSDLADVAVARTNLGLGTAATRDTGTGSTNIILGNDSRLTNSREWTGATVTQAEAEAGTSTTRRAFTPQRVFQAIAAWWNGSAASAKLNTIEEGAQVNTVDSVAGKTGAVTLAVADVANAVSAATTISAGNGLTGGGTLASNRTLTLGTPGTLTTSSTNSVSAESHTHAVTFPVTSVAGKTGAVTLTASDVGLGSVDNTADSAKSVASAATLTTARTINGTSFNGSANITTANWGTARNLTIGSTAKSVDGSAAVSWSLAEIGAAEASHNHNPKLTISGSPGALSVTTGRASGLEVIATNAAGQDAGITFNNNSTFAVHLGLDRSTNLLSVGGWSMGAVVYPVFHSGLARLDINGRQTTSFTSLGSNVIDCASNSNFFVGTINADSTFSFANVPSNCYSCTLELTHTSGTVTWPSSVRWPGNSAPTLTAGRTHLFMFVTRNAGVTWRGAALADYTN